ncbi:hypothetical protein [Halostella salina]|uniref:hypothetical protein n=1 Tax=Halostella salina TaxID=1547897 RepID=UPI0013CF23D4|nr:hypothetical protein [Halostella salina]
MDSKPHTLPLRERIHEVIARNVREIERGRPGHRVLMDCPFEVDVEVSVDERWLVDVVTRHAAAGEPSTERELLIETSRKKFLEV